MREGQCVQEHLLRSRVALVRFTIGIWVGRKCSLELQQDSVVMAESVLESGVNGSPPILVNTQLRSEVGE